MCRESKQRPFVHSELGKTPTQRYRCAPRITPRPSASFFHMKSETLPVVFSPGDFVREIDGDICGRIRGPGDYPDEWRVADAKGREVGCLGETLRRAPEPAGWSRA